jgi:hypothetical protein
MDKIGKSIGASAEFSSKALGLSNAAKGARLAPRSGSLHSTPAADPPSAMSLYDIFKKTDFSLSKPIKAAKVDAAPAVYETLSSERAKELQAIAGVPMDDLSLSPESRAIEGKLAHKVATTVDAGAPAGSGKRIRAYGDSQQVLAPKGGGFDGSA